MLIWFACSIPSILIFISLIYFDRRNKIDGLLFSFVVFTLLFSGSIGLVMMILTALFLMIDRTIGKNQDIGRWMRDKLQKKE